MHVDVRFNLAVDQRAVRIQALLCNEERQHGEQLESQPLLQMHDPLVVADSVLALRLIELDPDRVPDVENQLTGIAGKISSGKYLQPTDDGVVIGDGLARFLKLQINDTLVIITQGYHGISAAGKFPVKGLIKHVSPELNKSIIYMELKTCQNFLGAENKLTSLVVNVADNEIMAKTLKKLKKEIHSPYSVMSWEEMQPEIVQQIESDRAGGVIMKAILYIVIAFGILGTIMMMIAERRREFGVMISIGMQKRKLAVILFRPVF